MEHTRLLTGVERVADHRCFGVQTLVCGSRLMQSSQVDLQSYVGRNCLYSWGWSTACAVTWFISLLEQIRRGVQLFNDPFSLNYPGESPQLHFFHSITNKPQRHELPVYAAVPRNEEQMHRRLIKTFNKGGLDYTLHNQFVKKYLACIFAGKENISE